MQTTTIQPLLQAALDPKPFHLIHTLTIILLTALLFSAIANPNPKRRPKLLITSGILALTALIAGFGLSGILKIGFPPWLIGKIICWFALTALIGITFRHPKKTTILLTLTILIITTALYLLYYRPLTPFE